MVNPKFIDTLRKIYICLNDNQVNWVITGSFGMALQGMDVEVHDIDIQTDKDGAYEIEKCFSKYMVRPVHYSASERISSHFGALEMDGIKVEIMGGLQKRLDDLTWEEPVKVEQHKYRVEIDGMNVPVLSLQYEYQAYLKLGRIEKAEMLREWLQMSNMNSTQEIIILPFQSENQVDVKNLILAGLTEHWGVLDLHMNPDINDINSTYANAVFLVAWYQKRIAGTGALVPRSNNTAEIVRMSVAADMRRKGIGRKILHRLCEEAKTAGYTRLVLETTETWDEAIEFYKKFGFQTTYYLDGDVYFALDLPESNQPD